MLALAAKMGQGVVSVVSPKNRPCVCANLWQLVIGDLPLEVHDCQETLLVVANLRLPSELFPI